MGGACLMSKKGQSGLVGAFIGVMVAGIVAIGVAIPIITSTISTANLTGTTKTIVDYSPMMIGLVFFVAIAGLVVMGRR